ncbi:MAG TPA: EAL domain-containing protein [Bacillota bacterium]|nr:EAL domain-containing protein [Bacillota bacterium]
MSISRKLSILLIVVSLFPIIVLTFQGMYTTSHHVEKQITIQNKANTHTVQMAINAMITGPLHGIVQLAQNSTIKTLDPVRIKPVITEMVRIYPYISLVAVDNAVGEQIVRSNNASLGNVARRKFFIEAMQGKQEVISGVIASQADQRLIVVIATPIYDGGRIAGVVQASLDLTKIRDFVIAKTKKDSKVYVIGRDGKLLAHPDYIFFKSEDRLNLIGHTYVKNALLGKSQFVKTMNFEKQLVLLNVIRDPKTGWVICSETPYAKVLRESHKQIAKVLVMAIGILMVIVVLSVKMARRIARPITMLQLHAEKIAGGNILPEKIPVNTNDEIGKLTVSFQHMVDYLFKYAYYDTTTGLHNRKYFINALEKILLNNSDTDCKGAIIFLDLDNFKTINDSFGHTFGDLILKEIANRFSTTYPELLIAKFGGDEFGIILNDINELEEITRFAHSVGELIKKPIHVNGQELLLTASLGIALYPQDGETAEDLMKKADIAMYQAKENGRNMFEFYITRLSKDRLEKLNLEIDLRKAVLSQEFITYYQPQYSVNGEKLTGFEALVRWNSPKYGFLNPGNFIEVAERTGIISDIGEIVFRQACLFAKKINQKRTSKICVSINISPIQLMQSDFICTYSNIIIETGVNPEWIGIEITESTIIDYFETNLEKIKFMKEAGLEVSLDDFGTGYSSLNYLRKLPVSVIKIDKSFMDDICKDDKQLKLSAAIINIAHELNLQVVAEGVETLEQFNLLAQLNCDYVQGYLFSKPVPEGEAYHLAAKAG